MDRAVDYSDRRLRRLRRQDCLEDGSQWEMMQMMMLLEQGREAAELASFGCRGLDPSAQGAACVPVAEHSTHGAAVDGTAEAEDIHSVPRETEDGRAGRTGVDLGGSRVSDHVGTPGGEAEAEPVGG